MPCKCNHISTPIVLRCTASEHAVGRLFSTLLGELPRDRIQVVGLGFPTPMVRVNDALSHLASSALMLRSAVCTLYCYMGTCILLTAFVCWL
jgi:hypothetical protein